MIASKQQSCVDPPPHTHTHIHTQTHTLHHLTHTSRIAHCTSGSLALILPRGKPQPASFFQPFTSRHLVIMGSSMMAPL